MQTATMESTQVKAMIPPALFDELKKRVDAKGGIGYYWAAEGSHQFPSCLLDFAADVDSLPSLAKANPYLGEQSPSVATLFQAFNQQSVGTLSDHAVFSVNNRKGVQRASLSDLPRITFDELAAEIGLVRGEA